MRDCSIDKQGVHYYTFLKVIDFGGWLPNMLVWVAMMFIGIEEFLLLFLKTDLKTKINCIGMMVMIVLTILFNMLFLANALEHNYDAYFKIIFFVYTCPPVASAAKN